MFKLVLEKAEESEVKLPTSAGSLKNQESSRKNISVQFSSVTQSCPALCDPMNCTMPGLPVHHQLPEFTQTHMHWVGDAIYPCHPLLSPSLPAPNPSQHQNLFQWVSSSHQWPKYWSFSFIISLSNEYSGLIPFRIDWFDLDFFPFWLEKWFDLKIDWLTLG